MWKIILLCTALLCATILNVEAGNALGPCGGGRGVPVVETGSGGACNLPSSSGFPTVSLNQDFFANGVQCGECYEVTGPLGTVTVMVTDMCGSSSPKCSGDKNNFGIQNSAYAMIANANSTDIIYDLGYRRVTCDVTGNIAMQIIGFNDYFFSTVVYNTLIGVVAVGVKCQGWNDFEALTRGTNSAVWSWNKNNRVFAFPLIFAIVGESGQVFQHTVTAFKAGDTIDFGSQFPEVPAGNGLCPLAMPPAAIFNGALNYGWSTTSSFAYKSPVSIDSTNLKDGQPTLFADLYGYGGLQVTRNGGFAAGYFSTLQFDVRSNTVAPLRVYLGALVSGQSGGVTQQMTTDWTTFNISLASLTPKDVEFDIVFQLFQQTDAQFWLANVQFSLSPTNPLTNVTYVTPAPDSSNNSTTPSTTGDSTGSVGGTGIASTGKFNFGTSSTGTTSGSSTSAASTTVISFSLFLLSFICVILF